MFFFLSWRPFKNWFHKNVYLQGDYIVSILDEKQQVIEKKTVSLNDDTLICFGECNDLESITPKMAEPEEELEGSGQGKLL